MSPFRSLMSAGAAMAMVTVPIAAQAQSYTAPTTAPVSVYSTGALNFSALAAMFQQCQGANGCVLPLSKPAAVEPPAAEAPAVAEEAVTEAVEEAGDGIGILPILLALAAVAGGIFLLTGDDGEDEPVSP